MRLAKILGFFTLFLTILVGCGGGRDIEISVHVGDRATATAASQVAQPASLPSPTVAATAAGPAEAQPTATSSAPQETAPTVTVPPTEAPTEAPPEPTAPPPPATEAPQVPGDVYTFDPGKWEASVTALSSFRQKVALDFTADGTAVQSKAFYQGEVTTNPTALHAMLRVEGQAASQLPTNQAEVIWIGEQAWVKIGRRPWLAVPVTALQSEYAGQVVGVGELLPYIPVAHRVMPDETVNGIACKHYVYDINDLQVESGMTDARGDIWVAKDGGYVVRLTMNGHGTYYDTYSASGTLNLVYGLYDVNAPISINPPR